MATPMAKTKDLRLLGENVIFSYQQGVCKMCLKSQAAYTCPRCNISYCSLVCYKSERHTDCSESFYRANFIQALKKTKGSSEDKNAVLQMLARLDAEESGDDSDDDDDDDHDDVHSKIDSLQKRLAGVDLDAEPDTIWEKLTPQERQEFEEVLRAGALGSMLEEWIPWWTNHDRELITDIGEDVQRKKSPKVTRSDVPQLLDSIPSLPKLTASKPSPIIVFNMVNIIYCYAFLVRFYNGSHMDMPVQAVQNLFEICRAISPGVNYPTLEDALQDAVNTITQLRSVPSEKQHLLSLIQDVVHLLVGRSRSSPSLYVDAAFSDLLVLLKQAKRLNKDGKWTGVENQKKVLFLARKKLEFYLAWIREYPEALKKKAAEVRILQRSMEAELQRHEALKAGMEENLAAVRQPGLNKKLIQEI